MHKRIPLTFLLFFLLHSAMFGQGEKAVVKIPLTTDTIKGKKFALIIGVSSYEDKKLNKLNYAHTDAQNFRNFLLQGYAGQIENPETDIKYLVEKNAMYDSISSAVAHWLMKLRKRVKAGDVIYIYYSGHGVVSPEGQNLLPIDSKLADENLADLENNVALATIRTQVASLVTQERGIKVYYVIDACRKNEGTDAALHTANKIAAEFPAPGEYFFYAASEDQYSYETKELGTGNGVYTYFFLLGLRGAADKYPADNRVSIEELEEFVQDNVRNFTRTVLKGIPQKPVFKNIKDNDRQRILAVVPKDTVTKYKKIYSDLQTRLLSKSFQKELETSKDIFNSLARKGFGVSLNTNNKISTDPYVGQDRKFKDTTSNNIYRQFAEALEKKFLIEPSGRSAYDYYLALEKQNAESEITIVANEKLFSALVSKTQKLLDNYLLGKLEDRSKKTFDLAYNELLIAKKLLGEDNPYKKTLTPKLYFLHARALAGSTNPRDWDKGLQIIDSALSAAPKAAYSHYTKGVLFVSKHRYFSAIKHFTKATSLAPGWTYALHNLAKAYYAVAEYDKSISLSKQVIQKDSFYAEAYSLIALNYENVKMYDSAMYWNNLALSIDSTNPEPSYNLGRIYLKKDDHQLANTYFYNAAYGSNDVASIVAIGSSFSRQRQYDSALYYYNWALTVDPYHHESIVAYAELLTATNNPAGADSLYTDAIKRMGNDSRIYDRYVAFKFSRAAYAEADSLFNILVVINHEDPSIFIDYSRLLESSGALIKARNVLHQGLSYVTNSPSTIFRLANLYFKQNKSAVFTGYALDSSLHYFKRSKEITPTYSFTHFGLYQVNFALGNIDSALASLEKARSINKYIQSITNYNPDILSIADKALAKKDYKLAIRYYQLAKESSNDFKTNWKLGLVYYLSGDLTKASAACNELTQLAKAKSQVKELKQIRANILFDQKQFKEALELSRSLDDDEPLPNYLQQAACEAMLGNTEKAKSLIAEGVQNDPSALSTFINLEGLRYSTFLIDTLRKIK